MSTNLEATPALSTEKHLVYLDSARGIAALMVFAMHFIQPEFQNSRFLPYARLIFNGADAVSFFFVLSGFVLSYKYIVLKKPLDVRRFCVTRIFRLFPPFFIILVLNTLFYYHTALNAHTLADVFLYNKNGFWEESTLLKFHNKYYYPGWTLSLELMISFLMPIFIALAVKDKRWVLFMLFMFVLQGGDFYPLFLAGIVLSCYYEKLQDPSFHKTTWYRYRYLILAVAVVLFSLRQINAISPLGPSLLYLLDYLQLDFFYFTGFGAFIILGGILISRNTQRILSHRVLVFLGRISYSIYLVHTLMCSIVLAYFPGWMAGSSEIRKMAVMMVSYTIMTILGATIFHYFVELPFIRLGKRVVARIRPSLVIDPRE